MLRAAAIVVGLWFFVGAAAAQEPVRLALLIGNPGYAPSVGVLKNPHNDIAIVGEALGAQGFTLLPPVKDATRVQILGGIRELVRRLNQAGSGAVGFVYYSGHGAAEAQTNVNYLIPVDAQKPGTEAFWDEAVKLDEVLKLLSGASGAAKFVVFDACRNELRLPYRGAKGFEPVREQPGLFVAYTTAPGQPASDEGERQRAIRGGAGGGARQARRGSSAPVPAREGGRLRLHQGRAAALGEQWAVPVGLPDAGQEGSGAGESARAGGAYCAADRRRAGVEPGAEFSKRSGAGGVRPPLPR